MEQKTKTEKKEEKKTEVESKPAVAKVEEKKETKKEAKVELEREYVIPLRKVMLKAPRYRRARKAIKAIKIFLAKNMHVEDRDVRKIKINQYLNNEIWYRGIKNPPVRIKVKAVKKEGIVYVELADVPEKVKWIMERDKKIREMSGKAKKTVEKKTEDTHTEEEKKDEAEKEKATVQAGFEKQKQEAKREKHTATGKHSNITSPVRQSLKK